MNVSEERNMKKVLEDEDKENITLRWKVENEVNNRGKKYILFCWKFKKKKKQEN